MIDPTDLGLYVLDADGRTPIKVDDTLVWARWLETARRIVQQDTIGDVKVSTVFLGMDHAFGGGPPLLWETMIFGGPHDQYQDRYASREDAVIGHALALEMVRDASVADA